MFHARRQFRFLVPRLTSEIKILALAALVVAILLAFSASREIQDHRQPPVAPVDSTFGHEAGHNFWVSHSEEEEARRRAARQTELDARAERASKELGVRVQPEDLVPPPPPDPPSAAEH